MEKQVIENEWSLIIRASIQQVALFGYENDVRTHIHLIFAWSEPAVAAYDRTGEL